MLEETEPEEKCFTVWEISEVKWKNQTTIKLLPSINSFNSRKAK